MTSRFPSRRLLLLPAFAALLACDETTSTTPTTDCGPSSAGVAAGCTTETPNALSPLVGSWTARPNEYSVAHMVLRADGTGKAIGDQGTRRDVSDISWSADDSILVLSRPGLPDSRTHWSIRHDSLWIVTVYPSWRDTTAIFVRAAEPSLTASAGSIEPRMVGSWKGFSPTIFEHHTNGEFMGYDTAWEPETFLFRADGTGMNVTFEEESREDPVTGTWTHEWSPDDTTRFTWWVGGEYLYTSIWNPSANPPTASSTIGTQVTRWGFEGDSLLITKLWGIETAKRFGRQP
jgi:hypothetical protein